MATAVVATAAPHAAQRQRFTPTYWSNLRFLVFGRAVPGTLFGFMGWLQLSKVLANITALRTGGQIGATSVAGGIVSPALYTMFCCIPAVLYLTRPRPKARDGRLIARGAAFSGTLMQLLVGTFFGAGPVIVKLPAAVGTVSVFLSIAAFSGALWSLGYLRRCLSIIPETRRLVTGGPYRLVRHPLYFFEITAATSILAASLGVISTISFVFFVAMQMTRARFEERLLASTFPEYADYARRTRRLVPFVW